MKKTIPMARRSMHIPKIKIFLASFFETLQRYCKHVRVIWAWLSNPSKLIVSTCRKLWCLSACKKSTSSLIFFLKYCILILSTLGMTSHTHQIIKYWWYQLVENFICTKNQLHLSSISRNIAKIWQNLIFWVLWPWLAQPTLTDCIKLQKVWCLSVCKNQLHPSFLFWDIAKILQNVTVSTLGMPVCVHQKWYQLVEKLNVYLMLGMKFIPHLFLHMLLRYCKLGILGTLSMYRILTDQGLSMKYK